MYNLISQIVELFYVVFQGYCLQFFYGSFLVDKGKNKSLNGLYVAASYAIVKLCFNLIPFSDQGTIRIIENLILTVGLLVVIAFLFYKAVKAITVYLVVTFMAIDQISFFIAHNIYELGAKINDFWIWCIEKGYITDENTMETLMLVTLVTLQVLLFACFSVLCYLSLKKVVQSFREKEYAIHKTELLFILAPSLAGLLICVLLRIIVLTVENGIPELIYDKYPILILIIPAILILCLLSILYGIKLFQDMIVLNRERNSRIVLEKQVNSMQEHIAEMEHIYAGIRSMKHDMKNTITVITQLATGNETVPNAELQAYLSELNQTMDRLDFRFKTGNTVVDTLLNMKCHEITRTIPDLQVNADQLLFPEYLLIQSYDIGVILGNALDNAIEACKKQKVGDQEAKAFIHLSSFSKGKMFFIKVENSFDGEVIRKPGAEFPATIKTDKKVHGIGLANIKNTAEKYHGAVTWEVSNKVFTLNVMMKNERRTENEY